MAELVLMPKMGLTMTEGFLTNWKKSEGDIVTKGDTLFEVETDKLTNEYKSTVSGVLRKIIIKEGTVKVLEPVAIIAETGEDISGLLKKLGENTQPDTPNLKPKTVSKESGKSVVSNRERVKISPRAKKIAKELNVDISLVKGTGPENSITEDDIRNYSENKKSTNKKVSPTATVVAEQLNVDIDKIQKDTRIMKDDVIKFKLSEELAKYADPKESRKPMNTMRKVIGKRMLESVQTSPTVNYNIKVDTSALKHIREELKATLKVSYTDILVKIVSKTLLKFPLLNSSIDGNEIIIRNYVNMGVAVALFR